MNKSILIVALLSLLIVATFSASADEIVVRSIDPSEYYDSQPSISGSHVVWRRGIDQNNDGLIQLREPSWIMLNDISSGKTWNITEANKLMAQPNVYYHAQSPEIYGGKIIYEGQGSGNSWDSRLYMYNISGRDTWEVPLRSTDNANGHHHIIEDDWIIYTHKENDKRQAYLLNYADGNYRTIVGKNENYSVYGMVASGENIVITVTNETGNFELLHYGISSTARGKITFEWNYSKIIATSMYADKVAISVLQVDGNISRWNSYIYDMTNGIIKKVGNDLYGVVIWKDNIAYEDQGVIHLVNGISEIATIQSVGSLRLGDIYNNEIVWLDNSNGDWDVFLREEVTNKEIISQNLIFIIIVVAIVILLLLSRSGGGSGGML